MHQGDVLTVLMSTPSLNKLHHQLSFGC